MPGKRFHLGWFMNFTLDDWTAPFSAGGRPWDGDFYIDMGKAMERACFDYIMFEDTLMISDSYGGSTEAYLKYALMGPKGDPSPMAALVGAHTSRMGVVATMSTLGYPPFMLGATLFDPRQHLQGPLRLEHRHQRGKSSGAEFRSR